MAGIDQEAKAMAFDAHAGQKYGEFDYSVHLVHVTDTLSRFGFDDPILQAAGWLHDTLEDTDLTREVIEASCGSRVAEIVWHVTDEPGANRKERKAKTFPKIAADPDAIVVKIADRIANVTASQENGSYGLLAMYRKEHPALVSALRAVSPVKSTPMWEWLDKALREKEIEGI